MSVNFFFFMGFVGISSLVPLCLFFRLEKKNCSHTEIFHITYNILLKPKKIENLSTVFLFLFLLHFTFCESLYAYGM